MRVTLPVQVTVSFASSGGSSEHGGQVTETSTYARTAATHNTRQHVAATLTSKKIQTLPPQRQTDGSVVATCQIRKREREKDRQTERQRERDRDKETETRPNIAPQRQTGGVACAQVYNYQGNAAAG